MLIITSCYETALISPTVWRISNEYLEKVERINH